MDEQPQQGGTAAAPLATFDDGAASGLDPLHTRMVTMRLTWGGAAVVVAEGRILDLRKRGFVSTTGKLQHPGIIHDMTVRLQLEYPALRIRDIEPIMSVYPFAPSAATRGQGCPDVLGGVRRLVGGALRDQYGFRLTNDIGGARGCFHIFTLLRLLGPTIERVADDERVRRLAHDDGHASGHQVFARSIVIDGLKGAGMSLTVRGVLLDTYYRPAADAARGVPAVDDAFEARIDMDAEVPALRIGSSAGRVRRCRGSGYNLGEWERAEAAERLVGRTMYKGYTPQVQELFATTTGVEPLRDLLFMVAPAALQCLPSLAEHLDIYAGRADRTGPITDTCYMYRTGGPFDA